MQGNQPDFQLMVIAGLPSLMQTNFDRRKSHYPHSWIVGCGWR